MKSRYLDAVQQALQSNTDTIEIIGDIILVEEVPQEEVKTKSGLIVSGSLKNRDGFEQNRPTMAIVLAVGKGYYDGDTEIPLNVRPGDIVLLGALSTKWLSYFGPIISAEGARIGLAREADIQIIFKGAAGYERLSNALKALVFQNEIQSTGN
jgi:co-chaperonin GroES (HSP10)